MGESNIGINGKTGFANWVIRKSTSSEMDGAGVEQVSELTTSCLLALGLVFSIGLFPSTKA